MMRLFVAFELPEALRLEIVSLIRGLRDSLPAARWVAPEHLHLTLHFVGEREESRVSELCESLEGAFSSYPHQMLEVGAVGSFPPNRRARVVWLGLEGQESLDRLQGDVSAAVDRATSSAGSGDEAQSKGDGRAFTAHLTLARCRAPWPRWAVRKLAAALAALAGASFVARQGVLFRSQLGGRHARYTRVATFPLSAAAT